MRFHLLRLLLACLLIAAPASLATGTSSFLPPALETVEITGAGYVAWRVQGPQDERVGYQVRPDVFAPFKGYYVDIMPFYGERVDIASRGDDTFRFTSDAAPGFALGYVDQGWPFGRSGGSSAALAVTTLHGTGERTLLAIVGADNRDAVHRVTLHADPNVQVVGRTTGPATVLREEDFRGEVLVARSTLSVVDGRAEEVGHVRMRDAQASVDVERLLFGGLVVKSSASAAEVSLSRDGVEAGSRFAWCYDGECHAKVWVAGGAPGRWTFDVERLDGGARTELAVFFADVTMP